jgi:hypothetical protein
MVGPSDALARSADVDGQASTNQLPRRPLTAWFRITGDYVQDAYAGWQINATIEDCPGHSRQAVIILGHPRAMAMRYPISQRQKLQAEIDRLSAYARQEDSMEARPVTRPVKLSGEVISYCFPDSSPRPSPGKTLGMLPLKIVQRDDAE